MTKWTKEKCREVARQCQTRTEFRKMFGWAYANACKNNWMNDICSHMIRTISEYRCIYSYEFSDNYVYIGLTSNIKNRHSKHMKHEKSSVNIHIKKSKLNPKLKQLTEYIHFSEAKIKEEYFLNQYQNKGWNILNRAKTGALGSSVLYWTKEKCKEEASKYKTRVEYQKKNHSSYNSALNNKWLDEICEHMILQQKPNGFWTKDKCGIIASRYKTRFEFFKKNSGVYSKAVKNGWLDDICVHMKPKKLRNYWTEERCKEEALKYTSRKEFCKKSPRAYQLCLKNNWIEPRYSTKQNI